MGLFSSIGRWFKALGYLLTGRIDSAREALDTNPHVLKAKYDDIIQDKVKRIQQYKKAVAALVAQQEKKIHQVTKLTDDVQRLEDLKTGAAAKAQQLVKQLKSSGKSETEIHANDDYQKCLSAFNDFSSTLEEKQALITELESSSGEYSTSISEHKVQLQQLLRDMEKIKAEADAAVADMISAKEEKEISDMISGISEDASSKELERLRNLRQKVKAETRISKELAGVDTAKQENEFLEYARKTESSNEFDKLIGLSAETDTAAATQKDAPQVDTKLPE